MSKTLKNQKGITLVELLAVMVIVGIIAAISIPAIGGLIENTRKDAFIATAQNMQEAARIIVTQESTKCATGCTIDFTKPATNADTSASLGGATYIENLTANGLATVVYTGTGYTVSYDSGEYSNTTAKDAFELTRDDVTKS